jgi:hypothetical protein
MPARHDPSEPVTPDADASDAPADTPADTPNRAARRARGKGGDQPPAVGKVRYTGRAKPVAQPRQWATRRSG